MSSFACVLCKKSKGKVKCECLCENATVHKQCMVSLALRLYEKKTDQCQKCHSKIYCLKPHHFSAAARIRLKKRLEHSRIYFGKTGMVPYYIDDSKMSQSNIDYLQKSWTDAVEEEIADSPEYIQQTLHNVKKRKLASKFGGCRWD